MRPVPKRPLHPSAQDVGDKLFSRKRVRQPGPQEAFAFSARRSCLAAESQSGGFSVLLRFTGVSCSLSLGRDHLLVREGEAGRGVRLSMWRFCAHETSGSVCCICPSHVGVGGPGVW